MKITSRQNDTVQRLRKIYADSAFRRESGAFLGAGSKLLEDYRSALGEPPELYTEQELTSDLLAYVTAMKSPPDCVFVGKIHSALPDRLDRCVILEDMQDPGNVGTIIRSAAAFGFGAVILLGDCADAWQLKTIRGSMGAVFRIPTINVPYERLGELTESYNLPLYSAVVHDGEDLRSVTFPERYALAIGNEGHGLRRTTIERSAKQIRIPINVNSESLNAAAAASILMWEVSRTGLL